MCWQYMHLVVVELQCCEAGEVTHARGKFNQLVVRQIELLQENHMGCCVWFAVAQAQSIIITRFSRQLKATDSKM